MTTPSSRTTAPAADASTTDPSSLGRVLAALEHDCPGSCSAAAQDLGANVWFMRRTPQQARRYDTLVVLDASGYEGPMHRARRLVHEVNLCVRHGAIRVTERRIDDSAHALATVSAIHAPRKPTLKSCDLVTSLTA